MLTTTVIAGTNIVEIDFTGRLETEAMAECHRALTQTAEDHGSIRLLARYGKLDPRKVEPGAFWEDLKNTVLLTKIERCAIVSDQASLRRISDIAATVLPVEVRTFERSQDQEARIWVAS